MNDLRVLVVDQDHTSRYYLKKLLLTAFREVTAAPDVLVARKYLEEQDVDVLVVDMRALGGQCGDEVLSNLERKLGNLYVPSVLIADDDCVRRVASAIPCETLARPFTGEQLFQAVLDAVESRRPVAP